MRKISAIIALLISVTLSAQEKTSRKRVENSDEVGCKRIEERLYLNSLLNKLFNHNNYVDSLKSCMGESPEMFLAIGRYNYNKADYTASIREFKKVIKSPTSSRSCLGESYYYLGLATYYTKEYDLSCSYSMRALEYGFNSSWTYNNLGLAYAENGNRDAALLNFKKSLETDPSNDVAAANMGWMYDKVHNDKDALSYYLYADSIVQGNKPNYKSGIIHHLIQLQREKEAYAIAEDAYQKFPNDKEIIEQYSKVLDAQQRYSEELLLAHKLLRMNPSGAYEWFSIAYIYHNAGQRDSAFYFYKVCLKYDPKKAEAYDNISLIYKELGMFKEAHKYVDIALSLDSNYHYFYTRKSEIYSWEHDYENAYLWLLKCKQRFPERKGYEFHTGYFLQQLKRYTEAIPYFQKALIDLPNDDRLLNNMGRCYAELGQQDSAFMYFEKALKINPENSYIYHNRAALYCDRKEYDLACLDLKQAINKEYNWVIDDKLIEMKKKYCPDVKTDLKVLVHEYRGNVKELVGYHFILLSDSSLNKSMDKTIEESALAIEQKEEDRTINTFNNYNIYPNPTSGVFSVETHTPVTEALVISVYNSDGKLVLEDSFNKGYKKTLNLNGVPSGMFVVIISNKSRVLSTKKITVVN